MTQSVPHIEARVVEFLRTRALLVRGQHFLVAASGGRDSTVLAAVMASIASSWNCTLTLASVHHGLRPEADAEIEFVEHLAEQLGAGFLSRHVDVAAELRHPGGSVQDAARRLRYRALEQMCDEAGASLILTAHHADDQAETLLAHFLRGSGPEGLSGIRPVLGRVVRPLLEISQQQIQDFAAAQGIVWMHDASNDEDKYRRNALRHHISPAITRVFGPGWVQALGGNARLFASLSAFLDGHEKLLAGQYIRDAGDAILVHGNSLNGSTEFEKLTVCRLALDQLREKRATLDECFMLLQLLESTAGNTAQFSGGIVAVREREGLHLYPPAEEQAPVEVAIGTVTRWGAWQLTVGECSEAPPAYARDPTIEYIDLESAGSPLELRRWNTADSFEPIGFGKPKSVGAFLADSGIPLYRRRRIPVLCGATELLWVCGVRLAQSAAVHAQTRRFGRLEFTLVESHDTITSSNDV